MAPHVVEMNEPANLVGIGSLGVDGIVVKAEELSDFINESGLLTPDRGGHSILLQKRHAVQVITGNGQMGPRIQNLSHDQGRIAC